MWRNHFFTCFYIAASYFKVVKVVIKFTLDPSLIIFIPVTYLKVSKVSVLVGKCKNVYKRVTVEMSNSMPL